MTTTIRAIEGTSRRALIMLAALALAGALFALGPGPAHAATTFTVNSTGDGPDSDTTDDACEVASLPPSGECTLRAAIEQANATSGADTINFNIPGTLGVKTISPTSKLPAIAEQVTINGYTQPGSSPNTLAVGDDAALRIQLDGTNAWAAHGLVISGGSGSVVKGLVINRFGELGAIHEVFIHNGARNNAIEGNFIGTDAAGTAVLGSSPTVVKIEYSPGNTIGGTTAGARNIISGNGGGIEIVGPTAKNNKVEGNYIGTDATGTQDLGNFDGVGISPAPDNTIGGTSAGAGNVISGNDGFGVDIGNSGATGDKVEGNFIGTTANGIDPLGNGFHGVGIYSVGDSTVGGTTSGAENVIAFNGGDGIKLGTCGPSNGILSNSIFSNAGLGIDLDSPGVNPNDVGDGDTGSNDLQNFPVLTSATTSGAATTISGILYSTPNGVFTIQFFASPAADPSTYGEGKTYLGQTDLDIVADASGDAPFTFSPAQPVPAGQVVTATAVKQIDSGTSEFSGGVTVNGPTITVPQPAFGSSTTDTTPRVSAVVRDEQTDLAKSDIKLFLDGRLKTTFTYDRATDRLAYRSNELTAGKHPVRVEATDAQGLKGVARWSFKVVR